ncbi:MAG: hypothetical protein LBK64_03885 [Spirochaetaceae bacterium]|jgi:hypothetical protein|nr:hypothetical protein [Spirochaetaceae bacterium]
MSIFEIMMLLCFAASWPVNIFKSIKARSSRGKSLAFLVIVWVGYASGITHKILFSRDPVMALYILNFIMVGIDISLWFINRRRDIAAGTPS